MNDTTAYLQAIAAVYPDLTVERVRLSREGQNSDVLIVNNDLVFRFPRYDDGARQLVREVAILRALQGRLPLPIPQPRYASLDRPLAGAAFLGYPFLPGAPLWRESLAAITEEAMLQALAHQPGAFLRTLHRVPLPLPDVSLPLPDLEAEWTDCYARIRVKLFPHMRPDARTWVTRHFETFLQDHHLTVFTPVLVHGDFGGSNILWDAGRQVITGIIDFGSSGLGDPACDCAGLL